VEKNGLRGTRKHDAGADSMMRGFMMCVSHQISFRWSNKWEWDGRTIGMYEEKGG